MDAPEARAGTVSGGAGVGGQAIGCRHCSTCVIAKETLRCSDPCGSWALT